ncbi:MAG: hypothetical protein WA783_22630 [Phormidesmis sp.]
MVQAASQEVTVAFDTKQALQQAEESLQQKKLSTVRASVTTSTDTAVPKKRTVKSGGLKAASLGGVMGAIAGGIIATAALNVPNVASVYNNATPLLVLAILIGAAFGGGAGGLSSFFAGANLDEDPASYRLIVAAASAEELKTATTTLLENGGRLL